ncbi:MAG TPA: TetR/AcrR family transcriptional regulator [Thermomicrobiales bacterium]|jgi:AcrR family transcriptional regulator
MSVESEGRERVLREAHALFLERGFAEVSMQQIADASGMTKASLYYHFRDKEDLFANVVQHEGKRLLTGLTAELDGVATLHEQLKRVALYFFRAIRSDIGRLMTDFQRHVSEESHKQMHAAFEGGGFDPIGILRPDFARARTRGEIRDVDVDFAVMLFFAMIGGCFKLAEQRKTGFELGEAEAEKIVDVFFNGVAAPVPQPV